MARRWGQRRRLWQASPLQGRCLPPGRPTPDPGACAATPELQPGAQLGWRPRRWSGRTPAQKRRQSVMNRHEACSARGCRRRTCPPDASSGVPCSRTRLMSNTSKERRPSERGAPCSVPTRARHRRQSCQRARRVSSSMARDTCLHRRRESRSRAVCAPPRQRQPRQQQLESPTCG